MGNELMLVGAVTGTARAEISMVSTPAPDADTGPDPRPFLDRLAATVELTATRSVLRQLITLADSSATLSDVELRERLTGLASLSSAAWGGVPARPGAVR
jgi:hypothetical protein